jgi:DNA-binding CsgD family transcriptional regulator
MGRWTNGQHDVRPESQVFAANSSRTKMTNQEENLQGTARSETPKSLSARELSVLELSSKGLTDKQIAATLNVSLGTVHTYWTRIRMKWRGKTRAEIVARFVTEQIGATKSGGAGNQIYMLALDSLPQGIIIVDPSMNVVHANGIARNHSGRTSSTEQVSHLTQVLPDVNIVSTAKNALATVFRTRNSTHFAGASRTVYHISPICGAKNELLGASISIFLPSGDSKRS